MAPFISLLKLLNQFFQSRNLERIDMPTPLEYTELPDRAAKAIEGFIPSEEKIKERAAYFADVQPRAADVEGGKQTELRECEEDKRHACRQT